MCQSHNSFFFFVMEVVLVWRVVVGIYYVCLFVFLRLWHINLCTLFNFYVNKQFYFLKNQLSIRTQFSSNWPIDRTESAATTLDQSGPGSNGNEGLLRSFQSSNNSEASQSDCLMSYPGHLLGKSHPSTEKQSVISTVPAN